MLTRRVPGYLFESSVSSTDGKRHGWLAGAATTTKKAASQRLAAHVITVVAVIVRSEPARKNAIQNRWSSSHSSGRAWTTSREPFLPVILRGLFKLLKLCKAFVPFRFEFGIRYR